MQVFSFYAVQYLPIKFLIHQFVPKPASMLSFFPECLCSEPSLCYGTVCIPWGLPKILTHENEEGIKIRFTLQTKTVLEKLCIQMLIACFYGRRDTQKRLQ